MDSTAALASIAGLLASLPDESVEGMLVTFDALAGVSDASLRPASAQLLRDAAAACPNAARRARLLAAADAVAAAQPCAFTPEGLTWQQAAAAQTVTQAEWDRRVAETPLPPPPGETPPAEEEREDDDDDAYMEEEPPSLPNLRVRNFFPGLVVRVARDFADAYDQAVCSGNLVKVLSLESTGEGCTIACLQRDIHLAGHVAGHAEVLENAGNAWFQPVPTADCLEDLCETLDRALTQAEDEAEADEDDSQMERLEPLREALDACREWLSQAEPRGPAPACGGARVAPKLFGRDHPAVQWFALLFAALPHCLPASVVRRKY